MPELGPLAWAAVGIAALIIGISKTSLPGASILSITLLATVLPAKSSTAAMLLLLIVGDVFALLVYRRHAHWPSLVRLAPAVVAGLLLGFGFLAISDDAIVRRAIGAILLVMIAITLWQRWRGGRSGAASEPSRPARLAQAGVFGSFAGFTTMVANAGGPPMTMYFLLTRTQVKVFLGTAAWFFAAVNLVKVPFLAGLGLFTSEVLLLDAIAAPIVVVGALIGMRIATRIDQVLFDRIVIGLTIFGSVALLF